mmetsp:Transcript_96708/g.133255  ORF Transcript_96708/g.133255 Transcript_96708/m.133255 type:complete len:241 (-) Transcript_96708:778-1500(-)
MLFLSKQPGSSVVSFFVTTFISVTIIVTTFFFIFFLVVLFVFFFFLFTFFFFTFAFFIFLLFFLFFAFLLFLLGGLLLGTGLSRSDLNQRVLAVTGSNRFLKNLVDGDTESIISHLQVFGIDFVVLKPLLEGIRIDTWNIEAVELFEDDSEVDLAVNGVHSIESFLQSKVNSSLLSVLLVESSQFFGGVLLFLLLKRLTGNLLEDDVEIVKRNFSGITEARALHHLLELRSVETWNSMLV